MTVDVSLYPAPQLLRLQWNGIIVNDLPIPTCTAESLAILHACMPTCLKLIWIPVPDRWTFEVQHPDATTIELDNNLQSFRVSDFHCAIIIRSCPVTTGAFSSWHRHILHSLCIGACTVNSSNACDRICVPIRKYYRQDRTGGHMRLHKSQHCQPLPDPGWRTQRIARGVWS